MYVALLITSFAHQATGENKTAYDIGVQNQQWVTDNNCLCPDREGRIVNPCPLQYTNGTPRFVNYVKQLNK